MVGRGNVWRERRARTRMVRSAWLEWKLAYEHRAINDSTSACQRLFNTFDFSYMLAPGEALDTPPVDAGWFGSPGARGQLGDWNVNPQKFPHGLKPLIDRVHALGMDFGLWVEPESVAKNSNLYRQHPDWIMNFPGRPQIEVGGHYVL